MSATSPSDAYFEARKRYLDVHSIEDVQLRAAQMKELTKEWEHCFIALVEAAHSGDREVWYALGDACQNARGTPKDSLAAAHWFQRAAEAGHTKAMVALGQCLQRSESTDDKERALAWYRKAADAGDPGGMIWLGFAYREGTGVSADCQKAVEWFIKAVEAGDGHSMIHVGRLYASYLQSPSKAVQWFLQAAAAGHTESHVALGMLYDDRDLDIYDPAKAVKWWHVVAKDNRGSVGRAAVALAKHYRDGIGTTRDTEAAREWLHTAMQSCNPKSEFHREAAKLLKDMEEALL